MGPHRGVPRRMAGLIGTESPLSAPPLPLAEAYVLDLLDTRAAGYMDARSAGRE